MLKIKVKTNDKRFFIPIPYAFIHLTVGILTSKKIQELINREMEKKGQKDFKLPPISKQDLKPLLKELSKHRGLVLVETNLKDGTEVIIKL